MAATVRECPTNTGTGTTVVVTTSSAVATNDVLIAISGNDFYTYGDISAPTGGPGGWAAVTVTTNADGGTNGGHLKAYWTVVSTGGVQTITHNFVQGDEEKSAAVWVIQNADTSAPIDVADGGSGAASSSLVAPSIPPSGSDSLLINTWQSGGGSTSTFSAVPGSPWVQQYDIQITGESVLGGREALTASGATGTRTATAASAIPYAVLSIAVKSLAAGTVPAECATVTAAAQDATITTTNIRKIADRGSTQDLTAGTTTLVDIAAGASVATGNYLIARVALDNAGASGAAPTLSVSDPRSNTWTVAGPANIDPGAASAGATCYIAYAKITSALSNGDDITFTYDVSVTAKAIVVEEWTNIHATTPVAVAATTATGTSTTPSISRTPTAAAQLFYGALAVEGPTGDTYTEDTDTTDGSWVTLTRLSTTSGTATNNQTINGVAKLVSGTTAQTWNPTITSRDWAQVALVLAAAVVATDVNAENVALAGTAETPSVGVGVPAENVAIVAAAQDATVTTGGAPVSVNAENAAATGIAQDAALISAPGAEAGAIAATAVDPTATINASSENAAATATAQDPTVVVGVLVTAECASATGASQDATGRIAIGAESITVLAEALFDATGGSVSLELNADSPVGMTGVANNATISTASQSSAIAESAAATATAEAPIVGIQGTAENSAAAGAAIDASITTAVVATAEAAAVAATATDPACSIASTTTEAPVTGVGQDATVSTSSSANAPAENSAVTATANDATVSVSSPGTASAENALAGAVAHDPAMAVLLSSESVSITAAANNATVSATAATNVAAESAGVTATALDLTALISSRIAEAAVTATALDADADVLVIAAAEAASASSGFADALVSLLISAELAAANVVGWDAQVGAPKGHGRSEVTTASRGQSAVGIASRGMAGVV
jgi:trimeric autotransporter adhesin